MVASPSIIPMMEIFLRGHDFGMFFHAPHPRIMMAPIIAERDADIAIPTTRINLTRELSMSFRLSNGTRASAATNRWEYSIGPELAPWSRATPFISCQRGIVCPGTQLEIVVE